MPFCPNCGKEVVLKASFCAACGKPLQWTQSGESPIPSLTVSQPQAFCPHCGAPVDKEAEICPKCGVRIKQPPPEVDRKNPGIAAVLSFLFTGLGQIYNGQIGKGIAFLVVGIVLAITIIVLIGIILYPIFWIYNVYDAYTTAKKINAGTMKPD